MSESSSVRAAAGPPPTSRAGRSDRREIASVIGLIVLGGAGILLSCGQRWLLVTEPRPAPFGTLRLGYSGRALYPALNALAVVALLAGVLVLISGSRLRRVLGALLCLLALVTAWYGLRGLLVPRAATVRSLLGSRFDQQAGGPRLDYRPAWAAVGLACSTLLLVAGTIVMRRAGSWQMGLSSRYAAPVEAAKSDDPWRSLDRGEDPTISGG